MGSTALLKQTFFDANWYADASRLNERLETNLSLEAFIASRSKPSFFDAGGWEERLADPVRRHSCFRYYHVLVDASGPPNRR